MDEVVIPSQLLSIVVLDGGVMEVALVDSFAHQLEELAVSHVKVHALHMAFEVELPPGPVFTEMTPSLAAVELAHDIPNENIRKKNLTN